MKCREIRYELPEFARGRLDAAGTARVAEHLSACPACSSEAGEMERFFGTVESKPWSPPDLYWASILPRVHQRLEEQSQFPRWTTRYALPLAAALILAVGFLRIAPRPGEDLPDNFSVILQQLSSEELQDVADQQAMVEMIHPDVAAGEQSVSADDEVESVKAILQDEETTTDVDAGIATGIDETGSRDTDAPATAQQPPDSLN